MPVRPQKPLQAAVEAQAVLAVDILKSGVPKI
jgi:hypothetical protein